MLPELLVRIVGHSKLGSYSISILTLSSVSLRAVLVMVHEYHGSGPQDHQYIEHLGMICVTDSQDERQGGTVSYQ